jgi:hypothetical protein
MATPESIVTPISTTLATKVKADFSWLSHHFLLLGITGGLVVASVYGVESLIAKHDLVMEEKADAKLAAVIVQSNAAQNQLATTQQQLLVMVQQFQAQNVQLAQSIATRNIQVAQQVKTDATLSAQDAAQRLSQQTKAAPGEVNASGSNVILDLPSTRAVIAQLDLLPAVQANATDTQKELDNETALFTKSQDENTQQAVVIADLKKQNVEQVAACAVEIKTVKAQARKSKIKWFFIGLVTGFVGSRVAGV